MASPFIIPVSYPNGAYGFSKIPDKETLLFKNATVWTNESEGILVGADVLVQNGLISKIGKNLKSKKAILIDATGKHLTTGIVDEHSHIAAASINEGGQNSSAEVSIEDVIDADDVDIYRNLAGGVTSIQILHGSANPIGGRSAIIKLKWGSSAKELIYNDIDTVLNFALLNRTEIKIAEKNQESAVLSTEISKSGYYPTVSFGYGFNTGANFSNLSFSIFPLDFDTLASVP